MAEIAIKIDDQEERFPGSTTVAEALKSLMSGKQRKQTIAVYANDQAVDLDAELVEEADVDDPVTVLVLQCKRIYDVSNVSP